MSTEILQANKNWLIWARKSAHFDKRTVAKKMRVNEEKINEWEKTGQLTYSQLTKLSELYKISLHLFFNGNNPVYEKDITDFRSQNNKSVEITPQIIFEIRNVKHKREILLDIEEEDEDFNISEFKLKDSHYENKNDIIKIIEKSLDLSNAKRTTYSLNHWIYFIEKLGVLVFQFYNISPKDLRGYAIYYDKLPIIGINHQETEDAKKFTLFHELTHLIIKKEGLSNLNSYYINNQIEVECNAIAAESILPSNLIKEKVKNKSVDYLMNDSYITNLSKNFKVSKEVIVRKFLTLNLISKDDYEKYKDNINKYIFQEKNKSQKSKKNKKNKTSVKIDKSKIYQKKAKQIITQNGDYYIQSLIYAYNNDIISSLDFARILDTSINVVKVIIQIMTEKWGQ